MDERAESATAEDLDTAVTQFASAARWATETVNRVPASAYTGPGLGEWNMRALIGHTSRALLTVEQYLRAPAVDVEVASPAAYFQRAAELTGSGPDAVRQRGVEAGAALGPDLGGEFTRIAERVLAELEGASDVAVTTAVGGMRLSQYLPTRTFELIVHGLDIARAGRLPVQPPTAPLREALVLAAELAAAQPEKGATALLALTGRGGLPAAFSVLP